MASAYDKASLVMLPNAYKDGKVYSVKPEDRSGDFTFTRSTAATRVNADGNIEKETGNLLTQSNSFNNWTNYLTTETSGQADRSGGTSAWLLEKTGASGSIYRTPSTSGVSTFSAYVKAGTLNWVRLDFVGGGSKGYFDLQNGVVGSVTGSPIDSAIEDYGNGWYRCSVTTTSTGSGVGIIPAESDGSISGTSGNIYIQDAQLEQGLVARDYIETTTSAVYGGITDNVPRLDYTDSSCPALLLEPLRTNLATQSEYFESWPTISNCSFTSNYTISPEGLNNASRLVFSSNGFTYSGGASQGGAIGTIYSISCYAKRNDNNTQDIGFFTNGSGAINSSWALTTEWKRFEFTYATTNNSLLGIAGNSGADVSVYGFQIERDSSYPTSYIPTYGSSVSRVNDDTIIANLQSKNIVGNTFSYYFEWGDYVANRNFEMKDSSSFNFLFMVNRLIRYIKQDGSVDSLFILPANGTSLKSLISYDGTTLKGYINGSLVGSVTNAKVDIFSDFDKLRLDRSMDDREELKQILLFPTALTDQEAIDLTTI